MPKVVITISSEEGSDEVHVNADFDPPAGAEEVVGPAPQCHLIGIDILNRLIKSEDIENVSGKVKNTETGQEWPFGSETQ